MNKKQLSKKEMELQEEQNRKHSEHRHYKNSQFILFRAVRFIRKHKNKKNVIIQEHKKEIERLNRVIQSKQKWGNAYKGGIIEWQDNYLKGHGIFNVGVDVTNGNEYIIDFNKNANILVGGAPGEGKTKFIQMIGYQALLHGSKIHIGEFKGGADFQRFFNKCNVVLTHKDLISLLKELDNERKRRVSLFLNVGAENLAEYNQITNKNMKREYLIIDELGEAMEIVGTEIPQKTKKEMESTIEDYIKSLARLGRAFGINLIFGTQRPDVKVIEGQTRDQFMKRVCFRAVRNTSNIVLDSPIASTIPEDNKGRCYINKSIDFDLVQIYLFRKDMIKNLPNLDKKSHLKLVNQNNQTENNIDKNNPDLVDYEID
jgi:DNA segregation ATPase FtsK/SpoIIIE-like protein